MSQRRYSATVEISTKNAQTIYVALKPDIDHSQRHTRSNIRLLNNTLLIDVGSDDLSHLRASLNSYLRLAKTAISCLDTTL